MQLRSTALVLHGAHEQPDGSDPGATDGCHVANVIDPDAADRQHGHSRSIHDR
jgi:hypothetical protein